jgi:hypothetical protein
MAYRLSCSFFLYNSILHMSNNIYLTSSSSRYLTVMSQVFDNDADSFSYIIENEPNTTTAIEEESSSESEMKEEKKEDFSQMIGY